MYMLFMFVKTYVLKQHPTGLRTKKITQNVTLRKKYSDNLYTASTTTSAQTATPML